MKNFIVNLLVFIATDFVNESLQVKKKRNSPCVCSSACRSRVFRIPPLFFLIAVLAFILGYFFTSTPSSRCRKTLIPGREEDREDGFGLETAVKISVPRFSISNSPSMQRNAIRGCFPLKTTKK